MIIFTPLILVFISVIMLFAIKSGRIVKHVRFLKIVNTIHLVAVVLWFIFSLLIIPLFGGRGEELIAFFIYFFFGAATLISNIVVLLINKRICHKGP